MKNDTEYLKYVLTNQAAGCFQWRKTFAFLPKKTISRKWIWLKIVYKRKARFCYNHGDYVDVVQYGTSFDILNNKWIQYER